MACANMCMHMHIAMVGAVQRNATQRNATPRVATRTTKFPPSHPDPRPGPRAIILESLWQCP